MVVVGEDLRKSLLAHGPHRDAIDQAITFIGTVAIEIKPSRKRFVALRDDADAGVGEHGFDIRHHFAAQIFWSLTKERQVFRKNLIWLSQYRFLSVALFDGGRLPEETTLSSKKYPRKPPSQVSFGQSVEVVVVLAGSVLWHLCHDSGGYPVHVFADHLGDVPAGLGLSFNIMHQHLACVLFR